MDRKEESSSGLDSWEEAAVLIAQEIREWSARIVEVPCPAFGNMPPCPFARQAWLNESVMVHVSPNLDSIVEIKAIFPPTDNLLHIFAITDTENFTPEELVDWIDEGNSLASWAEHVGLDLPIGAKPTRSTVVSSLRHFNADGSWHSLRRPNTDASDTSWNAALVHELGILEAPPENYGRLFFRTLELPTKELADWFLSSWRVSDLSPSWRHQDILDHLRRHPDPDSLATVMLMSKDTDPVTPRERYWNSDLGFINLFQGRDNAGSREPRYEGDRDAGEQAGADGRAVMQIHYVHKRGQSSEPMFTLAINLGGRQIVRRQGVN